MSTIGGALRGAAIGLEVGAESSKRYMDLYEQAQAMQDRQVSRQRQQNLEAKATELAETGAWDADRPGAFKIMRDTALEQGDLETASRFDQQWQAEKKVLADKAGLLGYQILQINPAAAGPYLNEYAKASDRNDQFQIIPKGDGTFQVKSTIDGQNYIEDVGDVEHLRMGLGKYLMSGMMGAQDFSKYELESGKAQAYSAAQQAGAMKDIAATRRTEALLPYEQAEKSANIQQSQAAAGASGAQAISARATAAKTTQELQEKLDTIDVRRAKEAADLDRTLAETDAKLAETAQRGQPTLDKVIESLSARAEDVPYGSTLPPTRDKTLVAPMVYSLQDLNGLKPTEAGRVAGEVLRAIENRAEIKFGRDDGLVYLPGRTQGLKIDPSILAAIMAQTAE